MLCGDVLAAGWVWAGALWDQYLLDELCAPCSSPSTREWVAGRCAGCCAQQVVVVEGRIVLAAAWMQQQQQTAVAAVALPRRLPAHQRAPVNFSLPGSCSPSNPSLQYPLNLPYLPTNRSSVIREFRYVATLTAAQLATSWVAVQLALGEARDTAERQLAAEERKKGGKVGGRVLGAVARWVDLVRDMAKRQLAVEDGKTGGKVGCFE